MPDARCQPAVSRVFDPDDFYYIESVCPTALQVTFPQGCDLLVLGDPSLDLSFENSCRPWAKRTLRINSDLDYRGVLGMVLTLLDSIPARDGLLVTLRMASHQDAEMMFRWQSDDRTRRYARVARKPTWDEHIAWVDRFLAAPTKRLCIIEHQNSPAGILRLDPMKAGSGFEVTVVTDPKMYRQGVGLPAMRLARAWVPRVYLHAEVLAGNEASRSMVLAAGYEEATPGQFVSPPIQHSLTHKLRGRRHDTN